MDNWQIVSMLAKVKRMRVYSHFLQHLRRMHHKEGKKDEMTVYLYGIKMNNLRYADDTILFAGAEELVTLLHRVEQASLNKSKTKMIVDKPNNNCI